MNTQTQSTLSWAIATVPNQDTTLHELRELKQYWLDQAEQLDLFETCRRVVRNLGSRYEHELHYPWNDTPAYRWQKDGVEIRLITDIGGQYLVSLQAFEQRDRMTVEVDGHRVAHYIFTNHPNPDRSDWLFIPGSWTMTVQAAEPDAQEIVRQAALEAQEEERQALLAELLIGIPV